MHLLQEYTNYLASYFNNPASRLNWIYLLSSLVLAFGYFIVTAPTSKHSFRSFFLPKQVITSPSTRIDIYLFLFNALIKVFLFAPFIVSATYIAQETRYYLSEWLGASTITLNDTAVIVLYTVAIWLISDFSRFLVHLALHKNKYLWQFHKTHHSPETLNPITQYRIHPIEQLLFFLRSVLVIGLITGVFKYLFFYQLSAITIFGINAGRFIFLFMGSNLRHSHVPLRFGNWLEHIFISPAQHQIHHGSDVKYHNKNMGSQLAIWDWLFGTLRISKKEETIKFGLGQESKQYTTFKDNLISPIKSLFK